MKTVQSFTVPQGTPITFRTTPPDAEAVTTYGATLFKRVGNKLVVREKWDPDQLESGKATFTFDAESGENYEIDVVADVNALTMLEATVKFKTPPVFTKKTDLDPDEGLVVRVWRFEPV